MQTFYFIYKTTNLVNGKYYIGKHKTINLNDGYIGSGKYLKRSIAKHGIENFSFEVLHWCESEELLNALEKELVTEEHCLSKDNYNLCVGGSGGFSYLNRDPEYSRANSRKGRAAANAKGANLKGNKRSMELRKDVDFEAKRREKWKATRALKGPIVGHMTGKKHSPEMIEKLKQLKSHKMKRVSVDGIIYGSVREAAEAIGMHKSALGSLIRSGRKPDVFYVTDTI